MDHIMSPTRVVILEPRLLNGSTRNIDRSSDLSFSRKAGESALLMDSTLARRTVHGYLRGMKSHQHQLKCMRGLLPL